jgi:hypothetical protein
MFERNPKPIPLLFVKLIIKSPEEFYKVFTVAGIEGFCMKNFITIQK